MIIDFYDVYSIFKFPPVRLCVLSLCTPNLDFERGGCWRTRVTHDRQTVFSDERMPDLGGSWPFLEQTRSTFPGERFDDCNSLSETPKTSNLSKSSKTSKEVKIQEILPSEVDSNRESRSWSEAPKDVDSNGESWSWTDIVKNFRSENSRGDRNQSLTDWSHNSKNLQ